MGEIKSERGKPMSDIPKQSRPDWLYRLTCGLEAGDKMFAVMESDNFAIVKSPGRRYRSGQQTRYGEVSWAIVPKHPDNPRDGADFVRVSQEVKSGGRATKADRLDWANLLQRSEQLGRIATAKEKP